MWWTWSNVCRNNVSWSSKMQKILNQLQPWHLDFHVLMLQCFLWHRWLSRYTSRWTIHLQGCVSHCSVLVLHQCSFTLLLYLLRTPLRTGHKAHRQQWHWQAPVKPAGTHLTHNHTQIYSSPTSLLSSINAHYNCTKVVFSHTSELRSTDRRRPAHAVL